MKYACRQPGAPEMVDVHTPTQIRAALACCARCPAFTACRHELDSQPPEHQPYGVTAGRVLIDRDAKRMRSA